jgi:hypothetical protein
MASGSTLAEAEEVSKSDANNTALLHWQAGAGVERWALFCAAALRHSLAACAAGPKQAQRPQHQCHIKFAPWRRQGRATGNPPRLRS